MSGFHRSGHICTEHIVVLGYDEAASGEESLPCLLCVITGIIYMHVHAYVVDVYIMLYYKCMCNIKCYCTYYHLKALSVLSDLYNKNIHTVLCM